MPHLFQVGVGSGGMVVLDLLARDPRVDRVTLLDPDTFRSDNLDRHSFDRAAVGRNKATAARDWLLARRPDLEVHALDADLLDPAIRPAIDDALASADLGVCAVDNEPAKIHFDALMRRHRLPWALGEVLSGGIGGFVHRFRPGGPCYACVASFLQRSAGIADTPAPDYSAPAGERPETRIPASCAAISAIASLHALLALELLGPEDDSHFTTLLWPLKRVPGVFDEAFRPYRFHVGRDPDCLICRTPSPCPEDLDAVLELALARLG